MTKINIITLQGYKKNLQEFKENFNQYLYQQSDFRSKDYTLLKNGVILFSTKDRKCCWCDTEQIVSNHCCQTCLDLMKDQNTNAIVDRRYQNDVLTIYSHDIEYEIDNRGVKPYNSNAPYLLRVVTKTKEEISERRIKTQTVLNALADECGSELPADFESRMQRLITETKDGIENCCLESILYAVQNLGATAQQTRIRLNIWRDELKRFEDKVAEPPKAYV